jgi:hypothetical protein
MELGQHKCVQPVHAIAISHCADACLFPIPCSLFLLLAYFMGPIHPRPKMDLAERMALGLWNLMYGGEGALSGTHGRRAAQVAWVTHLTRSSLRSGPVISGCEVLNATRVRVFFNATLLRGESVLVQPHNMLWNASNFQACGCHRGSAGPRCWVCRHMPSRFLPPI